MTRVDLTRPVTSTFLYREEAEIEKLALAKKLALTCRTSNEDDKAK